MESWKKFLVLILDRYNVEKSYIGCYGLEIENGDKLDDCREFIKLWWNEFYGEKFEDVKENLNINIFEMDEVSIDGEEEGILIRWWDDDYFILDKMGKIIYK